MLAASQPRSRNPSDSALLAPRFALHIDCEKFVGLHSSWIWTRFLLAENDPILLVKPGYFANFAD